MKLDYRKHINQITKYTYMAMQCSLLAQLTNKIGLMILLKYPFGDVRQSQRYTDVIETVKKNPNVEKVVRHSLGGSVALELEKSMPNTYETNTYGALVVSFKCGNRYRHRNDVISAFDVGAKSVGFNINPIEAHSFQNY